MVCDPRWISHAGRGVSRLRWRERLKAVVARVGDVDDAIRISGNAPWEKELAGTRARRPPLPQVAAIAGEDLNTMVAGIGNQHPAAWVDCHTDR